MPELRPDPDHDAVCASHDRHQVVIAPPGTGKTYLSVRLAGELAPGLTSPAAQVLVVTFSNQARTQLEREAVRQLTPATRQRIEITNYHRFFWHAVLAHRRALGLPMRIDIGSHARRMQALAAVGPDALQQLKSHEGLVDSLAEHAHPEFRDERTPNPEDLARLLEIVGREQRAGRLVFDDLGALFWRLLDRFPVLDEAYRRRYPVVIADEHQDASALQDAVVRRLSRDRLVVLADPMQLIHGFRGASPQRLQRHRDDCDNAYSLTTAHRWHESEELAVWLLAVRTRLEGR
jgi:DNA helicase-2/ATP-dependent DNA helicase PcrA